MDGFVPHAELGVVGAAPANVVEADRDDARERGGGGRGGTCPSCLSKSKGRMAGLRRSRGCPGSIFRVAGGLAQSIPLRPFINHGRHTGNGPTQRQ